MRRIERAYKEFPTGLIYGGEDCGVKACTLQNLDCCPAFLNLGEDLDIRTVTVEYGEIKGCREISCEECWNKEYEG